MPCRYGIIRILGIVVFFAYRRLQSLSETVTSNLSQWVVRRLPHGTARLPPRLLCNHCSERLVREPAAFYMRSRDHLDVVADDPGCYLSALPGAPTAPKMISVHFLDCAKDGLNDAALVVLVHEPGHTALRATEMGLVPLLDKVAGAYRLAVPAPDLNVYTTRISNVSELDVPNSPVDDMVTV